MVICLLTLGSVAGMGAQIPVRGDCLLIFSVYLVAGPSVFL